MIRVPVYMNEDILKYKKVVEELTHKFKRKPTNAEIAKKLKVTVEKVRDLENSIAKMSSLDAPIGEHGDGHLLPGEERGGHDQRSPRGQAAPRLHRRSAQPLTLIVTRTRTRA